MLSFSSLSSRTSSRLPTISRYPVGICGTTRNRRLLFTALFMARAPSICSRHGQRRELCNIGTTIECPDCLDQRRNVIVRNDVRGRLAQLAFKVTVAHRIVLAAARGALLQLVKLAVGGRDLDRGGGGGEGLVALDRDLAAQRDDAPIVHASVAELLDAGFATACCTLTCDWPLVEMFGRSVRAARS